MVLTLVVFSETLYLLPIVKREIVGIQVFLAWVAARCLCFTVVAQPWITFVRGWIEISRKRFTAEFFWVVALKIGC